VTLQVTPYECLDATIGGTSMVPQQIPLLALSENQIFDDRLYLGVIADTRDRLIQHRKFQVDMPQTTQALPSGDISFSTGMFHIFTDLACLT
jgi:hypothetical protein